MSATPRADAAAKTYWDTGFAAGLIDRMAEIEADLARVTAANAKLSHELYEHRVSTDQYAKELAALHSRVAEQYAKGYDDKKSEAEQEAAALRAQIKNWESGCDHQRNRSEMAEARVAELEEKAERYRLTTLRQDATIAELTTDGNAATLAVNLAKVSQRNAELVAALEKIAKADPLENGQYAAFRASAALARAESATPAKEGFRLLRAGEVCLLSDDQLLHDGTWRKVTASKATYPVDPIEVGQFRRSVAAPAKQGGAE